mmetsp:Transcript_15193/g.33016  ORF Transcript_15193/g.33016 Transcript_15193/m.33016 type:complete len:206 (+) Transcript_15193:248-865(+)
MCGISAPLQDLPAPQLPPPRRSREKSQPSRGQIHDEGRSTERYALMLRVASVEALSSLCADGSRTREQLTQVFGQDILEGRAGGHPQHYLAHLILQRAQECFRVAFGVITKKLLAKQGIPVVRAAFEGALQCRHQTGLEVGARGSEQEQPLSSKDLQQDSQHLDHALEPVSVGLAHIRLDRGDECVVKRTTFFLDGLPEREESLV